MQGRGTYLVIVQLFAARKLDGPRAEILPDKRFLRRVEESLDIGCPCHPRLYHSFGVLVREVLDDCGKSFRTNLVLKHTKVTVGLRSEKISKS